MGNSEKNLIIRASAGSGKTFQLANRYLQPLFDAESIAETLSSMLASTFTRKAAHEISERIVTHFADFATGEEKRKEFAQKGFLTFPGKDDAETERILQEKFSDLIRHIERMNVGTLDSFFGKIANVFSLELGLSGETAIIGNDEPAYKRLIRGALLKVLNEAEEVDARRFLRVAEKKKFEEFVKLMIELIPYARETEDAVWNHDTPERLQKAAAFRMDERSFQDALEGLEKAIKSYRDSYKDKRIINSLNHIWSLFFDKNGKKYPSVDQVDWLQLFESGKAGILGKLLKHEKKYYDKTIPDDFIKAIRPFLDHAVALKIRKLIDLTNATRELLNRLTAELDRSVELQNGKATYDDQTFRLRKLPFGDKTVFQSLEHRLDGRMRHLMLDEFQDTSFPQWEILRPFAFQTAGDEDGSFFCVGDIKQAIFAWRGGVAAIFDKVDKALKEKKIDVRERSMDKTFRNRPAIVETVNQVFGTLDNNLAVRNSGLWHSDDGADPPPFRLAKDVWKERFHDHQPDHQDDGYSVLLQSDEKEDHEFVTEQIIDIYEKVKNRPDLKRGIGVLTQSNHAAKSIVQKLKERGYAANGGAGGLLSFAAVRYILSALILADHPGNTFARFHLMNGPDRLREPLQKALHLSDDSPNRERYGDRTASDRIRRDLLNKGFGPTIRRWSETLAPLCDPNEFAALKKLIELGFRYDENGKGVRTMPFLEEVEKAKMKAPIGGEITVSTIHGAKGLEYDVVILPELDSSIEGKKEYFTNVTDHEIPSDKTTPINFILRYDPVLIPDFMPKEYQTVFYRWIQSQVEESLCKLYVGMTRAAFELVMIVKPPRGNSHNAETQKTFGDVLRLALAPNGGANPSSPILYENGNPLWFREHRREEPAPAAEDETLPPILMKKSDASTRHHVARDYPSKHHTPFSVSKNAGDDQDKAPVETPTEDRTDAPRKKMSAAENRTAASGETETPPSDGGRGADWGTAIHACFELVRWLDEGDFPDDDALRENLLSKLTEKEVTFRPEEVIAAFHAARQKPEIAAACSRSRYGAPDVEVETERPFVVWAGDKIMKGRFDRLVAERDEAGKIMKVEILDYKTDGGPDLGRLTDIYRGQLDAYRTGAASLFGIDPEKVKMTLVFVTFGRTVTL